MITRRRFIVGCAAVGAGAASGRHIVWASNCEKPIPGPTPKGSFVRIFPEADISLDNAAGEKALQAVATAMTANSETPSAGSSSGLFPGYTYFGQFIDHDLTWNRVEYDASAHEQINAPNFRSPFLDLDSVYGEGPPLDCQFTGPPGKESFILERTWPNPALGLKGGQLKDIPFEGDNADRPVIGDRVDLRNAENLILRQLHVVFLKAHNEVIARLPDHIGEPDVPQEGTLFERARKLVTWTYQWLLWKDYLRRIRGTDARDPKPIANPNAAYQLPLEFVLAGFRFGHSMVQPEYALNCHHSFPQINKPARLGELVNSSQKTAKHLTEEHAVEWGCFFPELPRSAGVPLIHASAIDTHITPALGNLPTGALLMFSQPARGPESQNLAYRNLLRGARARIASGQQIAAVLRKQGKIIANITDNLKKDSVLRDAALTDNTPLWYYILKEAEITKSGDCLGNLGTFIVEGAIEGALQNDKNSYLCERGSKWKPPVWMLRPGHRNMSEFIAFSGATELAEGCSSR
jgi:hypothetical protein